METPPIAPVKTGGLLEMKVFDVEGIANHNGPESCGGVRKDVDEALTGEGAGPVWSREKYEPLSVADPVEVRGRPHPRARYRERSRRPTRSKARHMHLRNPRGNREVPRLAAQRDGTAVRIENPKGARR
jgi:hypothetical protein